MVVEEVSRRLVELWYQLLHISVVRVYVLPRPSNADKAKSEHYNSDVIIVYSSLVLTSGTVGLAYQNYHSEDKASTPELHRDDKKYELSRDTQEVAKGLSNKHTKQIAYQQ